MLLDIDGHLWKDKLYRGGLYVTKSVICYASPISGVTSFIPQSTIVSIENSYIQSILTQCIKIQYGKDQDVLFRSTLPPSDLNKVIIIIITINYS
jgi:hypothetical protein